MTATTMTSNEKLSEALKLLEEAARDKKEELRHMLTNKYATLKEALTETEDDLSKKVEEAKKRAIDAMLKAKEISAEQAKKIAAEVDESVHENPWPYIGGVALATLLIGYILGRNK